MRRIKELVSAVGLLLIVALGIEQTGSATARGFCNIDGVGPPPLQKVTNKAAAAFFDGGGHLMAMLSAVESDDSQKVNEAGSSAEKSFGDAGDIYKYIKGEESVDKTLLEVDPQIAATIAKLPDTWQVFRDITSIVKNPNSSASANLFAYCSDRAFEMKQSTAEFLKTKQDPAQGDHEKDTAILLTTWTRVLASGRAVSGFFAAAGGEK
jgi:hypothetical protein